VLNHVTTSLLVQVVAIDLKSYLIRTITSKYPEVHPPWDKLLYRMWWKQGNIKMAVSEDHASFWVHKDLTVTTEQIQALLTAARALSGKDECQV